jgi:hypothetical protein
MLSEILPVVDRLRQPLVRNAQGTQQPAPWPDLLRTLCERLAAAGTANPDGVRFLLSAHASHEELFLFRRLVEGLVGHADAIAVSWRYRPKSQPDGVKFKVPAVDAPNVNGARLFGLVNGEVADEVGEADLKALKEAVGLGRVSAPACRSARKVLGFLGLSRLDPRHYRC